MKLERLDLWSEGEMRGLEVDEMEKMQINGSPR